tara:strand:+ start:17859 stop:18005 length:147 start_codon:yes stop_codon:yes gene_type:complete
VLSLLSLLLSLLYGSAVVGSGIILSIAHLAQKGTPFSNIAVGLSHSMQ